MMKLRGLALVLLLGAGAVHGAPRNPPATGASPTPTAPAGQPTSDARSTAREAPAVESKTLVDSFLEDYTKQAQKGLAAGESRTTITAHGAEDVAAEALQILGQIVVDRASARAYDLLKVKLQTLLQCTATVSTHFPQTCTAIAPLRLQDVASSTAALEGAVLQDTIALALIKKDAADPSLKPIVEDVQRVLNALIPSLLSRSQREPTSGTADFLVSQVTGIAIEAVLGREKKAFCALDEAKKAITLASVAVLQCQAQTFGSDANGRVALTDCPIQSVIDKFALSSQCPAGASGTIPSPAILTHARGIAEHLFKALTVNASGKQPDPRARIAEALDGFFDASCLMVDFNQGCKASTDPARAIGLIRTACQAVIDRDTNALIIATAQGLNFALGDVVKKTSDAELKKQAQRGLALVGGVLQYAQTYRPTDPATPLGGKSDSSETDAAHARRTKILESLTQEMTNRSGREADAIWSLGGSLRLSPGVRFASGTTAFYGPLSLPLGIGFQSPSPQGFGLHLEFSAVDLGQYVSFTSVGTVRKPELADALAPTIGGGIFWGKEFPVTLSLAFGYSPQFQFVADETSPRGAFHASLNLGVYVPLLDIN